MEREREGREGEGGESVGGIEANYLWCIGYRRGLLKRRGGG